jgi:multiple sugar transport system substrate-binding protein
MHKHFDEGELVSKRLAGLLVLMFACAAIVAACGGGDDNGGGGSSGSSSSSTSSTGQTKGAKVIDVNSMNNAKGNVTYCTGKDTSGDLIEGVKQFNKANPGLTVKLVEFPTDAQQQHDQFTQRQRAKSGDCDAFESDVVWTAEFASQKWLYDMTPYVDKRKSEFIPSTLESITYDGKEWGAPRATDTGLLFYRTDKEKSAPTTWQQLYQESAKTSPSGIAYQGAAYEGLTCDFLEVAFAAGGKVLSDDGKKSEINSPQNLKALEFMVNGIKDGSAPKAVTTMMEEPARLAWEAGKVSFMRNWPYAYSLSQKAPKVKGKFDVAPLPSFEGAGKAGILGGHNMVISTYSKNPGGALKFIDFMTSPKQLTMNAVKYSKAPTIGSVYDDPAVKKAIPFAADMKAAVEQAKSRPVSPVYPQISEAIFKNVNAALSGSTSPQDALKKADSDISRALSTF